jgi:hypothetical protein
MSDYKLVNVQKGFNLIDNHTLQVLLIDNTRQTQYMGFRYKGPKAL